MQIGNFLQYDNVDALGNTLTYSDPCKFNAKFKGSNCFYSNTTANYITLGNKSDFSDVTTIEVDLMFSALQLGSTNFIFSSFKYSRLVEARTPAQVSYLRRKASSTIKPPMNPPAPVINIFFCINYFDFICYKSNNKRRINKKPYSIIAFYSL